MSDLQSAVLDQAKDSMVQVAFVLGSAVLLGRFAKAQPSWLAFALLLVPAPILILSFWWPWLSTLAFIYTPILMLVLLIDGFFLSIPAGTLHLSRTLSPKISIGQRHPIVLNLFNNGKAPIFLQLRDSVPVELMPGKQPSDWTLQAALPAFSSQSISYDVTPSHRGLYQFDRIHARYKSKLGLLWLTLQDGRPETVTVIPDLRRVKQLRLMASKAQNAGELQKRSLGLEGTQFSGLRHYFAGDDIRKMAWQASAKLDIPVVRTYTHEVEQPILVLLDAGRKMNALFESASGKRLEKYDWALNAALGFMSVAIDRGDAVGSGVFSNKVMTHVPLGTGRRHLSNLLNALSETKVQVIEPDYEAVMLQFARSLKRRALVVIFTDLIDPIASKGLLRSLKSFSANHLLMVVTLADNETIQEAQHTPEDAYGAYRKGVALDLLNIRRQTLQTLAKANNAIVIDAPADTLDETLIRQYLKLKQRNQL